MLRFEALVRENLAQGKWLCDYDCRRGCSGEFERTPRNGGFDAKKEVRTL
jgi:hypothetical protein